MKALPIIALMMAPLTLTACEPTPQTVTPAQARQGVLHATATASSDVIPDLARVSVGVTSEGKTAREAMAANTEKMEAVFTALEAAGIPREDVATSYLNLQPRYNYGPNRTPTIDGYQASNQVTVTARSTDKVGSMIDALLSAGINQINNVQFSVDDPESAQDIARAEAIAKAKVKARAMADAAGVKLGRLMAINEGGAPGIQPMVMADMGGGAEVRAMSAAPPTAPGQREISATVTLTYAIR